MYIGEQEGPIDYEHISGYNAQAIVDSKSQMVIVSDVYPNCADAYLGEPMLEKYKEPKL